MQVNVKAFLALRAVIDEGTVTAAAQRLHRTQPAISRLLAQLERDVGFPLFLREGRRLRPTAEGLTFYRETQRALAALVEIESTARDIASGRGTPLRIIAQWHLVHGLLHVALGRFCTEHPAFRFEVEVRQDEYISHWIANRLFDVGFTPERADHPQIANEVLLRAPLFCMLPARHRLARTAVVRAAQIAAEPVIAVRRGAPIRQRVDAFFAAAGTTPLIRGETASVISAAQLVSQGLGATIVDPFTAHLFIDDGKVVVRPLAPRVEMQYLVLRALAQEERPLTQAFIARVREAAVAITEKVVKHSRASYARRDRRTVRRAY
jgi:DNA-binding transcriptional LysR family regulator